MIRLWNALKAIYQLGLRQTGQYALYKVGLWTGHFKRVTNPPAAAAEMGNCPAEIRPLFQLPDRDTLLDLLAEEDRAALYQAADEIVAGKIHLFGAEPVNLVLSFPGKLAHWSAYETGKVPLPVTRDSVPGEGKGDVKWIWEPGRFGWAFTLGRAYHASRDEGYAEAFWMYFEIFSAGNPPCLGPHWMSGQEVALRLMALGWAGQVFAPAAASTAERKSRLATCIAAHAARIPPTLIYARSQHNNHLLVEAAGLLTAALALPGHPNASRWLTLGWRWLNHGLQSQIDDYGEYAQHSTNYHRLMLQVVLWTNCLAVRFDLRWPRRTSEAIKRSIHWLLSLLDGASGAVPNLGANDGAYIFPLTVLPFSDHRPVLYAAARACLAYDLPHGPWDEMALWFDIHSGRPGSISLPRYLGDQVYGKLSWAYFRTAQFDSRPSHADQLHFDLWWRGLNITQDPGTFLYNAAPPWDNALVTAFVHNTVTVDGRDQMTRAGRFLYLDWVNAYRKTLEAEDTKVLQCVRGRYQRGSFRHTRMVSVTETDHWRVMDELLPSPWTLRSHTARLHWLLPDWEWKMEAGSGKNMLHVKSPLGWITLQIWVKGQDENVEIQVSLVRAGGLLYGSAQPDLIRGWTSPTYGVKIPALSLVVQAESRARIIFNSEFILPVSDHRSP